MRRKPYSVVLFDEIEKAHPDVFNTLLQILDDGRLTDGQGRTVNFRNAVIIMTSNVGSNEIRDNASIGFSVNARHGGNEDTRKSLLESLRRTFRPEFLNRVDDIIVFNPLSKEHLALIIDIQLQRVSKLLETKGIHLEVTESAKDVLMTEGYDPAYGLLLATSVRELPRQRTRKSPLAIRRAAVTSATATCASQPFPVMQVAAVAWARARWIPTHLRPTDSRFGTVLNREARADAVVSTARAWRGAARCQSGCRSALYGRYSTLAGRA